MVTRRTRVSALLSICVLGLWSVHSRSETGNSTLARPPSIDISRVPDAGILRGITLDDMVSLRQVHEPRQSPDGRHVAFLVKQAFRSCDCYRTAVYITDSQDGSPAQKLTEEDYISNLQWLPDSRSISFLSSKGGSMQLWRLDLTTRRAERVFMHTPNRDRSTAHAISQSRYLPASGVLDYQWSPDGKRIAFTAEPPVDPSITDAAAKEGYRYDDTTMNTIDLMVGDWAPAHRPKQLWLYDVSKKREDTVWTTSGDWSNFITSLVWSPSGRKLAFFYSTNLGRDPDSIGLVDIPTLSATRIGSAGGTVFPESAAWSADEHAIAYLAGSLLSPVFTVAISNVIDRSRRENASGIYPSHRPWLTWDADRHRILFLSGGIGKDPSQIGIYAVSEAGGEPLRLTATTGRTDDCDVILKGKLACVYQAPSVPPRPVLVSVTDGGIRSLTDVNPELKSIELGSVRELDWKNKFGDKVKGYLVLPTHHTPGVRVPLVVMGYGFTGEFVTQANSALTTYPAQAFARDGIAVLLFNYSRYEEWSGPNFERGSRAIGYGPLSSIQAIVDQLDTEGLIDVHRMGMMGHSLSGFWVQLAITKTDLFKAVEMHNGGTLSEPESYSVTGSKQIRELQEHYMGGPPFGETLKNYLGYSMTLNADRIHAPVLMEYDAIEATSAMLYYEAMQHYGVPVDFFIYPNDGHVTERPEHRFTSLQRNLDWFEFWLLGKENDPSSKTDQYTRWRQFKAVLEQRGSVDQSDRHDN
jgi:dipeptidyl aminopeptidase/acylaminoacyl peptidase